MAYRYLMGVHEVALINRLLFVAAVIVAETRTLCSRDSRLI